MNIRSATLDDFDNILPLMHTIWQESQYRSMRLSLDKLRTMVAMLITDPDGLAIVVERDGQVIGGMLATCQSMFFTTDKIARDLIVFVEPSKRGGVIASKLIAHFEDWAKSRGACKIMLGTSTGVNAARIGTLYEKLGYETVGSLHVKEV